jgi:TPR repeat protein
MKRLLTTLVILTGLLGSAGAVWAGEYENAKKAYQSDDYFLALKLTMPRAKQGVAWAQNILGVMYSKGAGVFQDDGEAVKWYRKAADQGYAKAQTSLGWMYSKGRGVAQDYAVAVKWYRKAADQENAMAQNNLGWMYDNGWGVTQDYGEAVKWYRKAVDQGNAKARKNLEALEANTERAERYRQAAKAQPHEEEPPTSSRTGSGFFVSKLGHVVTNEHVVRNCGSVTVGDNANKQISATVLETDKRNDLALLKLSSMAMASANTKSLIQKLGLRVVPLSSNGLLRSDDVELGERLMVGGYPYGDIFSNTIKVTGGMVSAIRGMGDDSGQFQMDAAVQPGNSGGPIYDENGNIVGVVVAQLDKMKVAKAIGSLPENVNFGIKASTVRQFLISSGLPTKWSDRSERMSSRDIAKIAKNQTVMVVCGPG